MPEVVDPSRVPRSVFWFTMFLVAVVVGCIFLMLGFGEYGGTLFLALPLTVGALIGFVAFPRFSYGRIALIAFGIAGLLALLTLVSGFEGAICILMAYGIILFPISIGLFIGTALWRIRLKRQVPMLLLVCLVNPVTYITEKSFPPLYEHEVVTVVEVEASKESVWAALTAPVEFGASDHLLLSGGVTYPLDMRLDRSGAEPCLVCHLNNADARLRVTGIDSLRSLAFEPVEQPIPMRELSIIGELDAPHLHGYFGVDRGEFRLYPLGEGRTRLIATTRYHHRIAPAFYWRWWSDHLIDAMHRNVLRGVARCAEGQ